MFNQGHDWLLFLTSELNLLEKLLGRLKRGKSSLRADIIVSGLGLDSVVIEGEYDSPGSKPDKDAQDRLGVFDKKMDQTVQTAIAVLYPRGANSWTVSQVEQRLIKGAILKYAVLDTK